MNDITDSDSWYLQEGNDTDIILSTRVRIARNLRDFPFPQFEKSGDAEKVQDQVFEAFSLLPDAGDWQTLPLSHMDKLGRLLLSERSILPAEMVDSTAGALAVRSDGRLSCTINRQDHLHLSALAPGFAPSACHDAVKDVDELLQKSLRYAANTEFGYLTSRLSDTGTAMKVSCMLHLPAVVELGRQDELFRRLVDAGYDVYACFAPVDAEVTSIGAWFRISSRRAFPGSEIDQIASFVKEIRHVVTLERHSRSELLEQKESTVRDRVYRALATIKYSMFISIREGVELLSAIKTGIDLGILKGISDSRLYALLIRIQGGQLTFVLRSGEFSFERDVTTHEQKIARLRSLILQEEAAALEIIA